MYISKENFVNKKLKLSVKKKSPYENTVISGSQSGYGKNQLLKVLKKKQIQLHKASTIDLYKGALPIPILR